MVRRVIAGIIAIGLGLGIWALWPRGDTTPTTTGPPVAGPTTTSLLNSTTSSPLGHTSTTTTMASHVVEMVEEAEEILRELWFGWFEGIYNQDEDRIREVVATEELLNDAIAAFGAEFAAEPTPGGVEVTNAEILYSDADCLAVWMTLDVAAFRGDGAVTSSVIVLRRRSGSWLLMSSWLYRTDLWKSDCDVQFSS